MRDLEKIAEYPALNTLVFHDRKFEGAFAMAAELGVRYVEPACKTIIRTLSAIR